MNKFAGFVAGMFLVATAQAQGDGWAVYGGLDYAVLEISGYTTNPAPEPDNAPERIRLDFDADMIRGRVGWWMNEDFALEAQFGVGNDDAQDPDTAEIDSYYGIYLLPRAQMFDWLDVVFPLGFASTDFVLPSNQSLKRDSAAFGVNFQLNMAGFFGEDSVIGGLGIGAGFMVYQQGSDSSVRGYNGGIHFGYSF